MSISREMAYLSGCVTGTLFGEPLPSNTGHQGEKMSALEGHPHRIQGPSSAADRNTRMDASVEAVPLPAPVPARWRFPVTAAGPGSCRRLFREATQAMPAILW